MASKATMKIGIWPAERCFLTSVLKIACMLTRTTPLSTLKSGEGSASDDTLHTTGRLNFNAFKLITLHLAPSPSLRVGFLFSHEKNPYRPRRGGQLCQFARPGNHFLRRLLGQCHRLRPIDQEHRPIWAGGH